MKKRPLGQPQPSPRAGLTPRKAALAILQALSQGNSTLDALLDQRSHRQGLTADRRDQALSNLLVFGVLRWQGRIDWVLSRFSHRPLAQLSTEIRNVLRIGAFQILYLERIPPSAAVDIAVDLAKTGATPWAAGYVNATLRNLCRSATTVVFPDLQNESEAAVAARGSLPPWLASRWIDRYGVTDALHLAEAINRTPPVSLRANRLRTTRDALLDALEPEAGAVSAAHHAPDGIHLRGLRVAIGEISAFRSGLFQVQDEAAQMVTLLLDPQAGERILDACAGQGGKTGHIAQTMENRGEVHALDRSAAKLTRLDGEMMRLGLGCIRSVCHDLDQPLPVEGTIHFDRVLLDAPCSGLGVVQRNPDIKWHRRETDLAPLAMTQRRLMERVAPLVRPGGVLVYSVCSFEPEETVMVIDDFLARHPEFAADLPPDPLRSRSPALFTSRGFLCTLPHRHDMDGFFAARLMKRPSP